MFLSYVCCLSTNKVAYITFSMSIDKWRCEPRDTCLEHEPSDWLVEEKSGWITGDTGVELFARMTAGALKAIALMRVDDVAPTRPITVLAAHCTHHNQRSYLGWLAHTCITSIIYNIRRHMHHRTWLNNNNNNNNYYYYYYCSSPKTETRKRN